MRSRADNDNSTPRDGEEKASLESALGFQSLSGLFQEAPKPRYSRPKMREKGKVDFVEVGRSAQAEERANTAPSSSFAQRKMDDDYFQAAEVPSTRAVSSKDEKQQGYRLKFKQIREPHTPGFPGSRTERESSEGRPNLPHKRIDLRHPNPFAIGKRDVRSFDAKDRDDEEAAWGLRESNSDGMTDVDQTHGLARKVADAHEGSSGSDSRTLLAQDAMIRTQTIGSSSQPSRSPKKTKVVKESRAGATPRQMEGVDSASPPTESRLTHLTASGEAHMVDVGAKQATRRVAVAISHVAFSRPAPFQLIFENSNKKGDVLGVARIAGIMAAKRTADLIPLCHPVPITKVEVNVQLVPSSQLPKTLGHRGHNHHGLVTIETVVETSGPTGVEMEALTAASGAALTVYDMCKAVDRSASVQDVRVMYKSGGRSGVHVDAAWANVKGKEWFATRSLELPQKVQEGLGPG
ncbi:hypothetical protein LTS14_000841 [Recurvomyces mirabilis]|uniref:uncharacterized protein n=1 Tax=Recurvomyces mirabilis TaxID=574656 RepID=UPI002DE144AC|nr:hypothetical protein LTS14_000841 [Recurvomyces mirabilis]